MKKNILLLFVFIIIFSCKNDRKLKGKYTLSKFDSVELALDEETGFLHNTISSSTNGNNQVISFVNYVNNSVYYYDIKESKLPKIIKLEKEGVNGVGTLDSNSSLLFVNKDSIYVCNSFFGKLFLINNKGNVLKKYNITEKNIYPESTTLQPFFKKGNFMYFPCGLAKRKKDYSNAYSTFRLNLLTNKIEGVLNYPINYNNGFYGAAFKYIPSVLYNGKDFIVSYPIKNEIIKYDSSFKNKKEFYLSSNFISDNFPVFKDMEYGISKNRNYKKETVFTFTNSDYTSIVYDKNNQYYYRICHIRKDKNQNRFYKPDISVLIIDSNFNKVGETLLDGNKYHHTMITMLKEGLAIARRDKYKKNENELVFDVFKLVKNE